MRYLDPFFLLLRFVVLRRLYHADLDPAQEAFLKVNTDKQRLSLWVTLLVSVPLYFGVIQSEGNLDRLLMGMIGIVAVTGSGWYVLSFGGIPSKLLDAAMEITFYMWTGFVCALTATMIVLITMFPPLCWPALLLIYAGAVFSGMQYDTVDGMKIGLDETLHRHSRAALRFYAEQGIDPDTEDSKQ